MNIIYSNTNEISVLISHLLFMEVQHCPSRGILRNGPNSYLNNRVICPSAKPAGLNNPIKCFGE